MLGSERLQNVFLISYCACAQMSRAGDLADWLVRKSTLHPAHRDVPVLTDMVMGGWPDPTTRGVAPSFERLTLQLQRAAYARAMRLIRRALPLPASWGSLCAHACMHACWPS